MWKKEDVKPQGSPEKPSAHVNPPPTHTNPVAFGGTPASAPQPVAPPAPVLTSSAPRGTASIGQGIKIKGEVTGSEDLFVDGLVDGKLNLTNGSLTIGPNGNVKADVNAREVFVRGRIEGKVTGRDKVLLHGTAQVTGEVTTDRLAIEEGALLRGKVEAGRLASKEVVAANSGSAAD
jgi:cytoskeletal protein CcmA (bactofilin family)